PSRRTSFPSLGDTIVASLVRPQRLGTRSLGSTWSWSAGSPTGISMETAGSPKFPGNPRDHSPCSSTPVGPGRLSGPWVSCLARPPRLTRTRAHHEEISGLNRTAFDLAVYASQGWSPTHHARLASGCWSGSTGRDWLPAGFLLILVCPRRSSGVDRDVASLADDEGLAPHGRHDLEPGRFLPLALNLQVRELSDVVDLNLVP